MKPGYEVDRTDGGRYIVVGGRRWRASDPNIPDTFRQELVNELMDARRAVKAGKGNDEEVAAARKRVHNAKVALGERGEPWWDSPTPEGLATRTRAAVLALLTKRGSSSSICPSDAARIVASPAWREAMSAVRAEAVAMTREGLVVITQGDRQLSDPDLEADLEEISLGGPIRLRLFQE